MLSCYYRKYSSDVNLSYDGIGVTVRNGEFVAVLYERNGALQIEWYPQFLSQPFFTELVLRKFRLKSDDKEFKDLFQKRMLILQYQIKQKDERIE